MAFVFIYQQRPYKAWIKTYSNKTYDLEVEHCDDSFESVEIGAYDEAERILTKSTEDEDLGPAS